MQCVQALAAPSAIRLHIHDAGSLKVLSFIPKWSIRFRKNIEIASIFFRYKNGSNGTEWSRSTGHNWLFCGMSPLVHTSTRPPLASIFVILPITHFFWLSQNTLSLQSPTRSVCTLLVEMRTAQPHNNHIIPRQQHRILSKYVNLLVRYNKKDFARKINM